MIHHTTVVPAVQSWSLEHPRSVQSLLDCYTELDSYQTEAPGWEGLFNPKTVAKTVAAHAEYEALTRVTEAAGSPVLTAVNAARARLSSEIVKAVSDNLDYYTEQLEPVFGSAADAYEAAAAKLPREFTANDVTTFDAEQFDAYQSARAAAGVLDSARAFMLEISRIVPGEGYDSGSVSGEFLVLDPGSVALYAAVQTADTKGADTAYRAVNPVLLKAVKDGAVLRLALPSEATGAVNAYEHERSGMNPTEWAAVRSSISGW